MKKKLLTILLSVLMITTSFTFNVIATDDVEIDEDQVVEEVESEDEIKEEVDIEIIEEEIEEENNDQEEFEEETSEIIEEELIEEDVEEKVKVFKDIAINGTNVTLHVDSSAENDDAERAEGATYKTFLGAIEKAENGDTIKLDSDSCIDQDPYRLLISSGEEFIIDLNGHILTNYRDVGDYYDVIDIVSGGTLTIEDTSSKQDGEINGRNTVLCIENRGTLYLKSGKITNSCNPNDTKGGGIYNCGQFFMTGGEISSCNATYGGAVFLESSSTFTMSGGIICNNTAVGGGGIVTNNLGSFIMTGGEICNNTVSDYGGGIDVYGNTIIGGTAKIYNNKKSDGTPSDVEYDAGTVSIHETIKPTNGMNVGLLGFTSNFVTGASAGEKYFFSNDPTRFIKYDSGNIKMVTITTIGDVLATNKKFPVSSSYDIPIDAWVSEKDVKLYSYNNNLCVNDGSSDLEYAYSETVTSSDNNYVYGKLTFNMEGGILKSITISGFEYPYDFANGTYLPVVHKHDDVEFDAWIASNHSGAVLPNEAGNWYLIEDVILSDDWYSPNGTTNLCLNGHVINVNGGHSIYVSGTSLNLYDCETRSESDRTHIGYIDENGLWHLGAENGIEKSIVGGLITGSTSTCIWIENNGHFTMNAGTICGNTKTSYGAGVYVAAAGNTFIMNGGSIIYNTASGSGAGVMITNGTMTMTGGEISNNICGSTCSGGGIDVYGTLNIGGTAVVKDNKEINGTVDNVTIDYGKTLNIATTVPTTGMYVGITTNLDGELITNTTVNYSSYFFSDDSGKTVVFDAENGKLILDERLYNVTVQVQGFNGTATVTMDSKEITTAKKGDKVVFTATAYTDYEFDYWEVVVGDIKLVDNTTNPLTIEMPDKDLILKAHFIGTKKPTPIKPHEVPNTGVR